MKHFGSIKKLRAASEAEIGQVPGVGPATAQAVVAVLHADAAPTGVDPTTGEVIA